jgi:hypothetical protein
MKLIAFGANGGVGKEEVTLALLPTRLPPVLPRGPRLVMCLAGAGVRAAAWRKRPASRAQ